MPGNIAVAVSFGGTKVAVGLANPAERRLLIQSERIEWRPFANHPRALASLVAAVTARLLHSLSAKAGAVGSVGIAWPGPGQYRLGEVQATFLPGFETPRNIFSLLESELKKALGAIPGRDHWRCSLDVLARARGELLTPDSAWARGGFRSGLVLNVATGIGGAIIRNGELVSSVPDLGETYGQWGRFLICKRASQIWQWRPTSDGSIPVLDNATEIRLTDLCGGPALAKEFALSHPRPTMRTNPHSCRPVSKGARRRAWRVPFETRLLHAVTENATAGNEAAAAFVRRTGTSIGAALHCLSQPLALDASGSCVILTGGIGENFGLPRAGSGQTDLLLDAAGSAFGNPSMRWIRSHNGLRAELLGAVL